MKIFLIGFMGSGKTYWGKQMAEKLAIPFFDLDELIVEQEGQSISAFFIENGEEMFRLKEKVALEKTITENPCFVLSSGGGTPCFFNNIDLMKNNGRVIWLNTSAACLENRLLKEKKKRPLIREVSDEELSAYIKKKLSDRRIYYQQAHKVVNEDTVDLTTLLKTVLDE